MSVSRADRRTGGMAKWKAKGGDWESKPDQPEERRVGKGRGLKKEKKEKEKRSSRDEDKEPGRRGER